MNVYRLDPLQDSRWERFVSTHPQASVFHTRGWLEAVRKTYGYQADVYTTTPAGQELANGDVFCRVKSWLTGKRLVSLPFADHCQPLVDSQEALDAILAQLEDATRRERWKYVEFRPLPSEDSMFESAGNLSKSESFLLHIVDLRPDLDGVFRGFHKNHVQRKISRAEREQLTYEEGRSDALVEKFYRLLILTRRRHGLPPQPIAWFRNLMQCLGDKVTIHVASKDGQAIASILTLLHNRSLIYKYGCSDASFHNLGGMPWLHWKAIQEGKRLGAASYDLGRSEQDNAGLISFKENWGASSATLNYYRYPVQPARQFDSDWRARILKNAFSRMPDSFLTASGRLLYPHIG